MVSSDHTIQSGDSSHFVVMSQRQGAPQSATYCAGVTAFVVDVTRGLHHDGRIP